MKTLLSFSIFLFLINISIAQNSTFPKGIYETEESILTKTPTLKDSLKISKRSIISLNSDENMFSLESYDNSIKKKHIKKSFYGYSDGYNMYLNGYKYGIYYNYMPVIYEGKRFIVFMGIQSRYGSDLYHIQRKLVPYLTINDTSPKRSWGVNTGGFYFIGLIGTALATGTNKNIQYLYALDAKTNQLYTMSIETMQKLLDGHWKLLNEFNSIPNRHTYEVYLKYMKLLDSK